MLEKLKESRDFILVICIFLLTICTLELGYLVGLERYDRHDVNRDGKITSADYIAVKNYIMDEK